MAQALVKGDPHSAPTGCSTSSYLAHAWAHRADLASTLFLFICVSLLAGRVWRFPFDDETYTLLLIGQRSAFSLLTVFPATEDSHPPLSYLVFYGLRHLGLSDAGMRLCSLAMTAAALMLFQLLGLMWTAQRNRTSNSLPIRTIAVLLFGLSPLAVSQGDALRWYPLFALFIALFVTLYLSHSGKSQLCSGAVLGLSASTNLLATLIVPAVMVYRYCLQREFRWSFDLTFWFLAACGASLGIYSAYSLLVQRFGAVQAQFGSAIIAIPTDILGFFGGETLGVSQAWIVVPVVVIAAIASCSAINRTHPSHPAHLLLLMLIAIVPMVLAGFGKPRSFLYLAPVVAALLTLFFDDQLRQGHAGRVLVLLSLGLAASISSIANTNFGTHPFKRNLVIPYQTILNFINQNKQGSVLVVSIEPVTPWILKDPPADWCAQYFFDVQQCTKSGRHYDTVFVISGHNDRSEDAAAMQDFRNFLTPIIAGRSKIATIGVGRDEDAALKSRLTGIPLDEAILTVDFYR